MSSAPTVDAERMSKIGFAMGCIAFSDGDLDACLADLRGPLDKFVPFLAEIDQEAVRVALAQSLALAAALKNIHDVSALETLMLTVGFFGEPDAEALMTVKAIALDQALSAAVDLEGAGLHAEAAEDASRMAGVRDQAAQVMSSRGFGVAYFQQAV
ncbi:hypothetical protein [Polaromonas sp.]|uniref:hypothetical protein n=1 Tax=Polaromonas sp. TaxID=1869339 RepID=UPI00352A04CC